MSSSSSILTALSSSPQLSNDDTKAINSENSAKDVNDDVKRESSNNNSDSARIPSQLDSSPSHNDSTLLAASLNSNNTTNTNHNHNHNKKSSNHHNKSSTNNNNNHNFHLDATETAPSLGATASQQQTTSKLTNSLTLTNHNNNAHCSTTHKKKTRTMFPMQQKNYGPKATLKKVTEDYLLLVQDPLSQQLSWTKPPLHVLVLKKICNALFEPFNEIVRYLIYEHNLIVYVEENDFEHEIFRLDEQIKAAMAPRGNQLKPSLRKFCQPSPNYCCRNTENTDVNKIDLVVCLGGDGTLLHASGLFQKSCPPVLSIHMGSLGFLCPFDFDDYREYMNGVIKGGVPILLRNRIKFRVEKSEPLTTGIDQQSSIMNGVSNSVDDELHLNEERRPPTSTPSTSPPPPAVPEELIALNEVVISRGPSPYLSNLDLYINDYLMTTVQGDGLIISTPTGSTAYAMAAGASMCHPSVQSIIIAPICPHSLSFRPIVVPAGVELKIALNDDARHPSAWYSVDGRNTAELKQGYHISITASEFPVPSICRTDQVSDWFEGLATCLHWNQRQKQLPANACYQKDSRGQSLASPQSNSLLHSSLSSKSSSTSSLKFFGGNNNNHSNNNTNTIAHSTTSSNFSSKSISENEQHVASKLSEFGIESEDSGI